MSLRDIRRGGANRCSHANSKMTGGRRLAILTLAATAVLSQLAGKAQELQSPPVNPVVVELFTSEGCSSCPPADALLERMDAAQPIPGAQLIVLSEHVDYWDHDGWKDPYSSSFVTERQAEYIRVLRLNTAYTPQIIIDGTFELQGNGAPLTESLRKASATRKIPVHIRSVTLDFNGSRVLRGRAEVESAGEKSEANVYAALALDHVESQVLRGENSGKRLTHVSVVQEITKIGKLTRGSFSQDFQIKLKSGMDPTNLRLIVFVQTPNVGRILGAVALKVSN
jgi:hypothetical protein